MRALLFLLALLAYPPHSARAHDPWESVGFDRTASGDVLTINTNRGIMFSTDGGASFRYLCRNALKRQLPVVGVTAHGRVLVGSRDGLDSIGVNGCGLRGMDTPMSGNSVADLQRDPSNEQGWFATTTRGNLANGVFYSGDDGATWSALGALETGPYFKRVRASADARRIYVVVARYREDSGRTQYELRHSDDRGASWQAYPITLRADDRELVLLGVDPVDPDRVFAAIHVCRLDESCLDRTVGLRKDTLLVSPDRGQTWTSLLELGEVAGFAIDRERFWVGDWQGGLWRVNRDGSQPQQLSATVKAGCLLASGEQLFVCGSDLSGFMLARSSDQGTTLVPVAQSGNTQGNPVCPADPLAVASIEEICELEWTDLCRESFFDEPRPPSECSAALKVHDAGPFPGLPGVPDAAAWSDMVTADAAVRPAVAKDKNGCTLAHPGSDMSWLLSLLGAYRRQRR
jgi:hypothetical protein